MAKSVSETFYPLVQDSGIRKTNLFFIPITLYVLFVGMLYQFPGVMIAGFVLLIPYIVFLFQQNKQFRKNIRAWDKKPGEADTLVVNLADEKISVGGYEFSFRDVSHVKIKYSAPPPMFGLTKYLFYMDFINAVIIFEFGQRTVQMPLHSRSLIRKIVLMLQKGDFQMSFDPEIYRYCRL